MFETSASFLATAVTVNVVLPAAAFVCAGCDRRKDEVAANNALKSAAGLSLFHQQFSSFLA